MQFITLLHFTPIRMQPCSVGVCFAVNRPRNAVPRSTTSIPCNSSKGNVIFFVADNGFARISPATHSAAHWKRVDVSQIAAEREISNLYGQWNQIAFEMPMLHTLASPNREYSLLFSNTGLNEAGEVMSTTNSWRSVPCSSNINWSFSTHRPNCPSATEIVIASEMNANAYIPKQSPKLHSAVQHYFSATGNLVPGIFESVEFESIYG